MRYKRSRWARRMRRMVAVFLIILAILVALFFIAERRLQPTLMLIAQAKAEQIAKLAISDAVTKRISQQGVDFNQIVIMEKDKEGTINAVNFNFKEYSRIVGEATFTIGV